MPTTAIGPLSSFAPAAPSCSRPPAATTPTSSSFPVHHPSFRCLSLPSPPIHHHGLSHHSPSLSIANTFRPSTRLRCKVALGSDAAKSSGASGDDPSSSQSTEFEGLTAEEVEEFKRNAAKVGSRVKVKGPLKVFHIPRVPEFELTGLEGEVKQFVPAWKGKRISANYPFKIEFKVEIEGRGLVKFVTHLKEDEFEFI